VVSHEAGLVTAGVTCALVLCNYGAVLSLKKLGNQPGKSDAACLVRMGSAEQADWMVKNVSSNIPTGQILKLSCA
jgi:hypothetical protein